MWKSNWPQTQRRFNDWWNRKGFMIGMWGAPDTGRPLHADVPEPTPPSSLEERYCNASYRAALAEYTLSRSAFPAEVLPLASTDIGPGSLGLFCGCTPGFADSTVWFYPSIEEDPEPERLPPLRFDKANPWWRITDSLIEASVERAAGRYLTACPDLLENIDILSSLRGPQTLMVDMLERPEWVEQKVWEINQLWFEVYQRIYDRIRLPDGSSAFGAFYLWGPGKTAKVQCDASAMFSPAMFRQFVLPALSAQCDWLDHSLYHLDGTQALCHLDTLLGIEGLDAIEWTPQAGIEEGGHPRWYELYRRILRAGKSVQVVGVSHDQVLPLLDAIGHDGVYLLTTFTGEEDASRLLDRVAAAKPPLLISP
jgi:hypothetical protein